MIISAQFESQKAKSDGRAQSKRSEPHKSRENRGTWGGKYGTEVNICHNGSRTRNKRRPILTGVLKDAQERACLHCGFMLLPHYLSVWEKEYNLTV